MMFCSTVCKENLYSKAVNMDEVASVDVKMVSDIADAFGSVQNFDDFIQGTDLHELNKTIFDFDFTNPEDPDYKRNLMTCLLSLSTNDRLINDNCHIRDYISGKAVQHILSIYSLNRKNCVCIDRSSIGLAFGQYVALFASLINHSYFGNVYCVDLDNKVVTIACKSIKKGEQIFVCYEDFLRQGKVDIEELHMFHCECEDCGYIKNLSPVEMLLFLKEVNPSTLKPYRLVWDTLKTKDADELKTFLENTWSEINKDQASASKFVKKSSIQATAYLKAIVSFLTYPLN